MSEAIVAVAQRVRELEGLLAQLGAGLPPGGATPPIVPVGPWAIESTVQAGGAMPPLSSGGVGDPPPNAAGQALWTAPFATILGDVAVSAGLRSARAVGPVGSGIVVAPVPGGRISQRFRAGSAGRGTDGHDGLDIAAPLGTPVRAAAAGVVRFAGRVADGAVVVRIEHEDGSETLYGHLEPGLDVRPGDRVAAGDTIGRIGLTGRTTGPHLHFEFRVGGRAVDPEPILRSGALPGETGPAGGDETTAAAALRRFDAVAPTIPYAQEIRAAAVAAGIDPLLLAALVRTESGFRPTAVSRAGAMGLTQLMPTTARSLGVGDPFDPAANLDGGARYLAGNLRLFGRVDLALAAYQAGKAAVRAAGGIPDSPVTRAYVERVLGTWAGYLAAAEGQA